MSIILLFTLLSLTSCNENKKGKIATKKNTKNTNVSSVSKIKTDSNKFLGYIPIQYDTSKQYIYLTFDDGPQNGTVACYELCKKLGVKATFFMVGQHASSPHLKQIVRDIKNTYPDILLANHSSTHANGKYRFFYNHDSLAAVDFFNAQKKLDIPFKIIRLPGNSAWVREKELRANKLTKPVCQRLDSVGYNVIGWDVEWNFNHKNAKPLQTPDKMIKKVETAFAENELNEKKHLVILTHDRMFKNPNYTDSLAKFITLLKQNKNYVFETVDHYPNLKKLN